MLTLVGCSGGDGGDDGRERAAAAQEQRIAPAEYARRVDRLCARVATEVADSQDRLRTAAADRGPEGVQRERVADLLAEQLAAIVRFREDVAAIALPSAHAGDALRLVEKTRGAERELAEAVDALRAGDDERASEALERYGVLSLESTAVAGNSELPFAICGAGA